jgi:REP element-mobilizing transposase RayT
MGNERRQISGSVRSRGYLPHLEAQHPVYFVTFRLADSIPQELMARFRAQREALQQVGVAGADCAPDPARLRKLQVILRMTERCLDRGLGACHMRDSRIARVVADAIRHYQGKRYELFAWCVMPNHVHAVLSPRDEHRLQDILHSVKSFSAQEANRILGRRGSFWQREYFDHFIRNEESLRKIIRYVSENPRKAGLRDWPWVGVEKSAIS